eukprot:scaffold1127_cov361-Prasinococcus_capsulatus_cf.AAC.2
MGANITARIFAGLIHPHPANGMFLDACHHHSWYWGNITIDGRVVAQVCPSAARLTSLFRASPLEVASRR